jgi:DNA-binding GntR family transcriptional regulator
MTKTPKSTVETIADALREGVRRGRYMPGQRLVEADITAELGVSRGPLREALRRLAAEGVVDLQHHRGARVRAMSRKELSDLQEVRESLEALAAAAAARRVAKKEMKGRPILELADQMDRALNDGSVTRYLELNQAFHDLLVSWSNNPVLSDLVKRLQIPVFRLQTRTMADIPRLRVAQQDHRAIATAVASGDPSAAEKAMRRHIQRSNADARALPDDLFAQD